MPEFTNQDQTQAVPMVTPTDALSSSIYDDIQKFGVEVTIMKQQAELLMASGLLPKNIDIWQKAAVLLMKGKELGLSPMASFSRLYVVDGKVTMSAELMMSLIRKNYPKVVISFIQNDNEACRICVERQGSASTVIGFSIQDAQRANLLWKDNWKKYPRAMLRSRAVAEMARSLFPECLDGIVYTPEEIGDSVKVDQCGEVLEISVTQEPKKVVLEKVTLVETNAEKLNSPMQKQEEQNNNDDDRLKRMFRDTPEWWAWLDKVLLQFNVSSDFKPEISQLCVGREAGVILKLIHDVAKGEDNPLILELF